MYVFFFFNDTATTEICTLSLHDALPISPTWSASVSRRVSWRLMCRSATQRESSSTRTRCSHGCDRCSPTPPRSEEHTLELQSRQYLVCRLLLVKKTT